MNRIPLEVTDPLLEQARCTSILKPNLKSDLYVIILDE
jgi:hypothetical protein